MKLIVPITEADRILYQPFMRAVQDISAYRDLNTRDKKLAALADEIISETERRSGPTPSLSLERRSHKALLRKAADFHFEDDGIAVIWDYYQPPKEALKNPTWAGFRTALTFHFVQATQTLITDPQRTPLVMSLLKQLEQIVETNIGHYQTA